MWDDLDFNSFVYEASMFFGDTGWISEGMFNDVKQTMQDLADSQLLAQVNSIIEEANKMKKGFETLKDKLQDDYEYAEIADTRTELLENNRFDTTNNPALYYLYIEVAEPEDCSPSFVERLAVTEIEIDEKITSVKNVISMAEMALLEGQLTELTVDNINAEWETIVAGANEVGKDIPTIAIEMENYMHIDQFDLEEAKIYKAEMDKQMEHLAPHEAKGSGMHDDTMSAVMEAFRRWSETSQYLIDFYGSQNLINAVYEQVEEGADAFTTMFETMDLYYQKYRNGEFFPQELNEYAHINVPNADPLFDYGSFFI